jgi:DUF1009 family protein
VNLSSPLGLIAGNGTLPLEVLRAARKAQIETVVVAHKGETSPEVESFADHVQWINVGQLGKLLRTLTSYHVKNAIFAGGISRIKVFGGVSPDLKALALIARLGSMKDDVLLRGIAQELEQLGISVLGVQAILQESIPHAGCLTSRDLSNEEIRDARVGFEAARAIGTLDIGQSVVAYDGVITAVEAVEGTDATLKRAGELVHKKGGVLVKLCKVHQDNRLDLPSIGVNTITTMKAAGLTAIVLEAQRSLIIDPARVVAEANRERIALRVVTDVSELK